MMSAPSVAVVEEDDEAQIEPSSPPDPREDARLRVVRRMSKEIALIGSDLGDGFSPELAEQEINEMKRAGSGVSRDSGNVSFQQAAFCMLDGLAGRDKHGLMYVSNQSKLVRYAFHIQCSYAEWLVFILSVVLHTVLAYVEDRDRIVGVALVPVCLCVFWSDVALKATYMTPRGYLTKAWNATQVVMVCAFTIDYILFLNRMLQPFRALRPWLLLCREREFRRVFQALIRCSPEIFRILFLIFFYLLFFAAVGTHVFPNDYNIPGQTYIPEDDEIDYTGLFDNVPTALLRLFVLLTTENFPGVMMPAYRVKNSSFAYFGIFLATSLFFIVPMQVAVCMDAFWTATKDLVKKDRKKERKKLIEAFNFLDPDGDGIITKETWLELMKIVRPRLSREAHEWLFELMDKNGDGHLDALDWLDVGTVMKARVREVQVDRATAKSKVVNRLLKHATAVLAWPHWDLLQLCLILIYSVTFALQYYEMPLSAEYTLFAVRCALTVVFVADTAMRVALHGIRFAPNQDIFGVPLHWAELLLNAATVASLIVWANGPCRVGLCSIIGQVAQFVRLLYKSSHARSAVQIFQLILPLSIKLLLLLALTQFSYSVVAHEVFHGVYMPEPSYCVTYNTTSAGPNEGNFNTIWCSTMVMFQITTTANWHMLLESVMIERTQWVSFCFITYFILTNFIALSLMVGVFIEAFFKASKKHAEDLFKQNKPPSDKKTGEPGQRSPNTQKRVTSEKSLEAQRMATGTTAVKGRVQKNKLRRQQQKMEGLPQRCVAVETVKAHRPDDLPLHRGDVIELLEVDRETARIKGKCMGRSGWFDAANVLICTQPVRKRNLEDAPSGNPGEADSGPAGNTTITGTAVSRHNSAASVQQFVMQEKFLSRRDIVVDNITAMNPEELKELNAIAKANMLHREGRTRVRRNKVAPAPADQPEAASAEAGGPAAPKIVVSADDGIDANSLTCARCGKTCSSKIELKIHMRKHRDDPPLVPRTEGSPKTISPSESQKGIQRSTSENAVNRPKKTVRFAEEPKKDWREPSPAPGGSEADQAEAQPEEKPKGALPEWALKFMKQHEAHVKSVDLAPAEPGPALASLPPSKPSSEHPVGVESASSGPGSTALDPPAKLPTLGLHADSDSPVDDRSPRTSAEIIDVPRTIALPGEVEADVPSPRTTEVTRLRIVDHPDGVSTLMVGATSTTA